MLSSSESLNGVLRSKALIWLIKLGVLVGIGVISTISACSGGGGGGQSSTNSAASANTTSPTPTATPTPTSTPTPIATTTACYHRSVTDPSAISDLAYQDVNGCVTANQSVFYVYQDQDSGFNHGFPSGLFPGAEASQITINAGCIDDASSNGVFY
jgi:hypothetical protein